MSLFKSALFIFLFMSIFVVGYLVNLEVLPYQAAPILGIIIGMIMKKTWSSI